MLALGLPSRGALTPGGSVRAEPEVQLAGSVIWGQVT